MTNDEIIRLVLDVTDKGTIDEAVVELQKLKATSQDVADTTEQVGTSSRNMGQVMLQSSYAVQDFTSQLGTRGLAGALGAIQNNIPGILFGLGIGPGLAGVVSVASVAVGALVPVIQDLMSGLSSDAPGQTAEQLKKMAEEAKKASEAWEKFVSAPTKEEAAAGKKVEEATLEAGRPELARAFTEAIAGTALGARISPEAQTRMEELQKRLAGPLVGPQERAGIEEEMVKIRREAESAIGKQNKEMVQFWLKNMGDVTQGPAVRAMMLQTMAARPELIAQFPGLFGEIEQADPEAIKAQQEIDRQGKIRSEQLTREAKQRTDDKRDLDRQVKEEQDFTRAEIHRVDQQRTKETRAQAEAKRTLRGLSDPAEVEEEWRADRDAKEIKAADRAAAQITHKQTRDQNQAERSAQKGLDAVYDAQKLALDEQAQSIRYQLGINSLTEQQANYMLNGIRQQKDALRTQHERLRQGMASGPFMNGY